MPDLREDWPTKGKGRNVVSRLKRDVEGKDEAVRMLE